MYQMISLVLCLASIIWAFFSPLWAWSPIILVGLVLLVNLFGLKTQKWNHFEELSPSANEMLQRFGHYYHMPLACRDFSATASTIQFVGVGVGIVDVFNSFYWGIGLGILFYIVFAMVAKEYNPQNFIQGTSMEISHQEILDWLEQKSQREQEK